MKPYDKTFKEEAVKLSDDIGTKRACDNWGYHITHYQDGGRTESFTEKTPIPLADASVQTQI